MQVQRRCRGRGSPAPSGGPAPTSPPFIPSVLDVVPIAGPRTCRTHHPPARYREHFQDVGELIDIDNHSDVSEEELELGMADQSGHRPAAIVPANRSTLDHTSESASDPLVDRSTSNPTVTDPLATNTSSTSHKALDVEFFFRKEKENTIYQLRLNSQKKGSLIMFSIIFSPKTSNTTLHYHMEIRHTLLYLE
ncbi:hypothetical protein BDN67DRAFT_1017135 [Paxillus ammoniavirescens]|nr:hypothetical protein BDN67DRAFT_1017135 [Paxillus ammoniavirescens]